MPPTEGGGMEISMKKYIKLLRVKHYIKNGLLFIPLFFSGEFFCDMSRIKNLLLAFLAFSFMASVVYIINDINDVEKDRNHAVKRKRPIASGEVSIKKAIMIAGILFLLSIILNFGATSTLINYGCMYILLYGAINVLYSTKIKEYPIIDVVFLAAGFLIRVLYGAFVSQVRVSNWLLLTVIVFSLDMGLGKRRNELIKQKEKITREVLKYYPYEFLDKMMQMFMTLGIVFYSLWTLNVSSETMEHNQFMWTVPIVIFICMKYTLIVEGDSYGDPVDVLLSDKTLIGGVIVFV